MNREERKTKFSFIFWIIIGIFIYLILQYNNDSYQSENIEKTIQDNFSNITEVHWGHTPLTYKIDNKCVKRQSDLFKLAFDRINLETLGIVKFIEAPENKSDISIYCKPFRYDPEGQYELGDALPTLHPDYENLIIKGEINIYGQGQVCNTGYPALEVHEILHLFDIPHNPLKSSIMHPYSAESSNRCKTTQIDKEYISCLRYIYSNGQIEGNCSFPNVYENEYPSECTAGWYPVEGTNYCCPEPNMVIEDGYCV